MAQRGFSGGWSDDPGLCSQFVDALPVTGAAVSVFGASVPETSICASDDLAARLDELQFDLGEGPRWEAARSRTPVLVPHARHGTHPLWPVFGKALLETEVEALFVFPLAIGALDVGVVELYRSTPGDLARSDLALAAVLADKAAWNLLDQILRLADVPSTGPTQDGSPLSRREIHQATGMVLVQTGSTATDALMLLRAHAFSHDRTVRDVARDVVARRLVFPPPGD